MKRAGMLAGLVVLAVAAAVGAQAGGANEAARPAAPRVADPYGLRGLDGFYVRVDRLPYEVEKEELFADQLQTALELRLRKAGVRVLTRQQAAADPNAPCLHVQVQVGAPDGGSMCAYGVKLSLSQAARLVREPAALVDAVTWSKVRIGMIRKSKTEHIDEHVFALADEFLNAYLGENPRQ